MDQLRPQGKAILELSREWHLSRFVFSPIAKTGAIAASYSVPASPPALVQSACQTSSPISLS